MTESMHSNQPNASVAGDPRAYPKRPYVKPAFRHEKVFETMALACGKVQNSQSGCHANRKTS
jgi:hypothetical protein